ncbi:hypothetical protein HMPREF0971_02123 [Segatella oris F0302]|uniref:Uncharacterized protein n=1 Tax=Segatella oris F0302 TaxID=649760 RepID=D1QT00_9BACT|nr:hypothetical protein HMPREF0971_02123 [Segatella oris F0302]
MLSVRLVSSVIRLKESVRDVVAKQFAAVKRNMKLTNARQFLYFMIELA